MVKFRNRKTRRIVILDEKLDASIVEEMRNDPDYKELIIL